MAPTPPTPGSLVPSKGTAVGSTLTPTETSSQQVEGIEDLRRRVALLEQENGKQERARNYAQLERDRILGFWEVTRAKLTATEVALRQMSLQLEEQQSEHAVDIKAYRDRIRALVADHAVKEAEIKAAAEATLEHRTTQIQSTLINTEESHRTAVHHARLQQQTAEDAVSSCQADCERRVTDQRSVFEQQVEVVQARYDEKLRSQGAGIEELCHSSMHAAAQQRDSALVEASAVQQAQLRALQEGQAATVAAHLDLIAALKRDVEAARHREAAAVDQLKAYKKKLALN